MKKRILADMLVIIILLLQMICYLPVYAYEQEAITEKIQSESGKKSADTEALETPSYKEYITNHPEANDAQKEIILSAGDYVEGKNVTKSENYVGYADTAILTTEDSVVTYQFSVPEKGLYQICMDYCPIKKTSNRIERKIYLDGKLPFKEMGTVIFERFWKDDGGFIVDRKGNESRPSQVEFIQWANNAITDSDGYFVDPFSFYLESGTHTLTIEYVREPMALGKITFIPVKPAPTYQEILKSYTLPKAEGSLCVDRVEAEHAILKSDLMLYPTWDRTSPLTYPLDYYAIKLNTIGGSQWSIAGQWIEWEIKVPKDGQYRLSFRAAQNITAGLTSARKLMIDGKVPFAEAKNIRIPYNGGWQSITLGDEKGDWLFELTEGTHRLRLEVVLGDMAEVIDRTDAVLLRLNEAYRKIIVITGTAPDQYRDYYIEKESPETIEDLAEIEKELSAISKQLTTIFGKKSEQNSVLDTLADQVEYIVEKPYNIAKKLSTFKSGISSLGTWALSIREQPLVIDHIEVLEAKAKPSRAEGSFWSNLIHELRLFIAAFVTDYNSIGDVDTNKAITVWMSTGREQSQIVRQIIDRDFVSKYGVEVDLQLVVAGALLPSVLAGNGPDVMMGVGSTEVMNYAARGAIASLSEFADQQYLQENFYQSALIPLQYKGELYSLPEQQTFPVLFYRKDILKQLKITLPNTWEELYDVLHILSKNNMEFGIAPSISTYAVFLYQNGGSFYKENDMKSALDENVNINAFRTWANLYSSYGMPIAFDFANRFRTGEMPLAVADYTAYNQLTVFAPEIRGQWGFAPMIGTEQADGTINRSVSSMVSGTVVLAGAQNKKNCWEFIKWWTGEDAQAQYAREQESIMGSAARYPVANKKALQSIAWSVSEMSVLLEQWKSVKAIPEVPGGYYSSRYIDFAFKRVVLQGENVRETLTDYAQTINAEIKNKRREFGLNAYRED